MSVATLPNYVGRGLAAAMPPSPPIGSNEIAFYYQTDTSLLMVWNGTSWNQVGGGSVYTPPVLANFTALDGILGASTGFNGSATQVGNNVLLDSGTANSVKGWLNTAGTVWETGKVLATTVAISVPPIQSQYGTVAIIANSSLTTLSTQAAFHIQCQNNSVNTLLPALFWGSSSTDNLTGFTGHPKAWLRQRITTSGIFYDISGEPVSESPVSWTCINPSAPIPLQSGMAQGNTIYTGVGIGPQGGNQFQATWSSWEDENI